MNSFTNVQRTPGCGDDAGAPWAPVIPAGPCTPVSPAEPCTPVIPVEPCTPVIPVEPCAPVIPVIPVGPAGPAGPVHATATNTPAQSGSSATAAFLIRPLIWSVFPLITVLLSFTEANRQSVVSCGCAASRRVVNKVMSL